MLTAVLRGNGRVIISQTPLRISFFGGGTDLRAFYSHDYGAVLSTTIDRYVYVIVKRRFDRQIRVAYTKTEIVNLVQELEHDLVREALLMAGLEGGLEIITVADIPAEGTGLGSSSSLLVGLLNALYAFKGEMHSPAELARKACEIEIERLGRPIGKQDQYAAAFGGFRLIRFMANEETECTRVDIPEVGLRALNSRLLAFFTGKTRSSATILTEQRDRTGENLQVLREMRDQCDIAVKALKTGDLDTFGCMLHEGWNLKKRLATGISSVETDEMYNRARTAGALGGKLLGAGGGGFMLLYAPPECHAAIRTALRNYSELPFTFDSRGSRICFHAER